MPSIGWSGVGADGCHIAMVRATTSVEPTPRVHVRTGHQFLARWAVSRDVEDLDPTLLVDAKPTRGR